MIQELAWDTEFFGRKIGIIPVVVSAEEADVLIAEARKQEFRYLISRLTPTEIASVQILEQKGFYTTDIGIVWHRSLQDIESPRVLAREGTKEDNATVQQISAGIFREGRFYKDPFFTREEADRLYRTWAENLLKGDADKVFLIGNEGFVACKVNGNTGSITLIGVSAEYQNRGVGKDLVRNALAWFREKGADIATVRTQAGNRNAIAFYESVGFRVRNLDITLGRIIEKR
ncbi:MAG: GNAT family N-acetyltransferase [Nitrospirae bacterium]|nr:GNAT family N-acetyltransferase [Nitrospirota bacterium]